MVTLENHIDGEWFTSNYLYNGRKLQIKMRKGHGVKIHIWDVSGSKIIKTFRFTFSTEEYLLNKAKQWIDKSNK
jgi:hypothetical protein